MVCCIHIDIPHQAMHGIILLHPLLPLPSPPPPLPPLPTTHLCHLDTMAGVGWVCLSLSLCWWWPLIKIWMQHILPSNGCCSLPHLPCHPFHWLVLLPSIVLTHLSTLYYSRIGGGWVMMIGDDGWWCVLHVFIWYRYRCSIYLLGILCYSGSLSCLLYWSISLCHLNSHGLFSYV